MMHQQVSYINMHTTKSQNAIHSLEKIMVPGILKHKNNKQTNAVHECTKGRNKNNLILKKLCCLQYFKF